jgi:hypothetical protein
MHVAASQRVDSPGANSGENGGVSLKPPEQAAAESAGELPFPDSLCHRCAAPPRYIRTTRSTFLYCPILKRYPPQPLAACEKFTPKEPQAPES